MLLLLAKIPNIDCPNFDFQNLAAHHQNQTKTTIQKIAGVLL